MISLPGIGSLIVGALLTGGGFLSVVQLTLESTRLQAPDHLRYMAGLLTCGYALGELAANMLSALSSWRTGGLEPVLLASMLALAVAGLSTQDMCARFSHHETHSLDYPGALHYSVAHSEVNPAGANRLLENNEYGNADKRGRAGTRLFTGPWS